MRATVSELGGALRVRRQELGLSQLAVCQAAGVARSWLSRVEAGRHGGAELQKVLDLAAVLDLELTLSPTGPPEHGRTTATPVGEAPVREAPETEVPDSVLPQPEPRSPVRSRRDADPFEHLFD